MKFTREQIAALCGGELPYAKGFAWSRVSEFRLEDGVIQPYAFDQILPGPGLKVTIQEVGLDTPDEKLPVEFVVVLCESVEEGGRNVLTDRTARRVVRWHEQPHKEDFVHVDGNWWPADAVFHDINLEGGLPRVTVPIPRAWFERLGPEWERK